MAGSRYGFYVLVFGTRFQVPRFGNQVFFWFRVSGFRGFGVLGFRGLEVWRYQVWGVRILGSKIWGLGYGVRVQGLEFMVQDLGFRV